MQSNYLILDRSRQTLTLEGCLMDRTAIAQWSSARLAESGAASVGSSTTSHLARFLTEWFDTSETVPGQTSGSTGAPKQLALNKDRMIQSARMTCSFLGLSKGDSALLCMPLKYIGAKMVVVRALVAGLDLTVVEPSSHPLSGLSTAPSFTAMTPMQVMSALERPREATLLREIRHLIIGGGAISPALADALRSFPNAVWSTYGMTETLSHIALRRLSGDQATDWYTPFDGVEVGLSGEGTLTIDAPSVCAEHLVTHDLADLDKTGRFRIRGRSDNTINSGGIKVQIEVLEEHIRAVTDMPFQITAAPDPKLGEQIVMLTDRPVPDGLAEMLRSRLPKYHMPRRFIHVHSLPLTGSGKPDRALARRLAAAHVTDRLSPSGGTHE